MHSSIRENQPGIDFVVGTLEPLVYPFHVILGGGSSSIISLHSSLSLLSLWLLFLAEVQIALP